MDGIGLSLYQNAFIIACFETLSFITADHMISHLPRRRTVLYGISLACTMSFLFVILKKPEDCGQICSIVIIQIIMAGVCYQPFIVVHSFRHKFCHGSLLHIHLRNVSNRGTILSRGSNFCIRHSGEHIVSLRDNLLQWYKYISFDYLGLHRTILYFSCPALVGDARSTTSGWNWRGQG